MSPVSSSYQYIRSAVVLFSGLRKQEVMLDPVGLPPSYLSSLRTPIPSCLLFVDPDVFSALFRVRYSQLGQGNRQNMGDTSGDMSSLVRERGRVSSFECNRESRVIEGSLLGRTQRSGWARAAMRARVTKELPR